MSPSDTPSEQPRPRWRSAMPHQPQRVSMLRATLECQPHSNASHSTLTPHYNVGHSRMLATSHSNASHYRTLECTRLRVTHKCQLQQTQVRATLKCQTATLVCRPHHTRMHASHTPKSTTQSRCQPTLACPPMPATIECQPHTLNAGHTTLKCC